MIENYVEPRALVGVEPYASMLKAKDDELIRIWPKDVDGAPGGDAGPRPGHGGTERVLDKAASSSPVLNVLPCDLAEASLVEHVADYSSSLEMLFRDSPGCLCMPVVICIKAIECFKNIFNVREQKHPLARWKPIAAIVAVYGWRI